MHCDVYKFPKHDEMYVYIARPDYPDDTDELRDWLGVLPKPIRQDLGPSKFVMHLDLAATPKLARADKQEVIAHLKEHGFYLQTPPAELLKQQAINRAKAAQDKKYD